MVEYVAKNDTVYNFKFYHKGQTVEAGTLLDSNPNFERIGGSKPTVNNTKTGATISKEDEVALRMRAKELKIANWHTKTPENLQAEIAKAEAKLAAPAVVTTGNGEEVKPDGDAEAKLAAPAVVTTGNGEEVKPDGDAKGKKSDN